MARIGDRGEMEAFVRSVELASFSAAARELRLTPSAVSKLVTRLERSLKVKLLYRTTRHIHPTPEGELFLTRCRRILEEMEDAEMEVGRSRDRPRGRLRMHLGVGVAMHLVVPALPRFFARYPEVQIDLFVEDRRVDLLRENIDISVRPWSPEQGNLVVRTIFEFERMLVASPGYVRGHGAPRSPEELARHRCMGVSTIPSNRQWLFQTPNGPHAFEIVPGAGINNADCVYQLAIAGVGIARLNEFIVAPALHDGRLVQLLADFHCEEHLKMLAIYPQERHRLPRVRAMLDFLQENFAGRPWRRAPAVTAKPKRERASSRRR